MASCYVNRSEQRNGAQEAETRDLYAEIRDVHAKIGELPVERA